MRSSGSVEVVVLGGGEQRAGGLRPVVGGGDGERLLRLEVVEEGALGHARRGAQVVDARGAQTLACG